MADRHYVEDCLETERVQPDMLWFAEPGWSVTVTLGRSGGRWQLLKVGNVYP
jgi:hypothetical protein